MCGLVGLFDTVVQRDIDVRLLTRMNDRQAHRGPDGAGIFTAPGVGLGHRRLAIVDIERGRQPLFNEDGSVCVVFNGEIYNHQPLRRELERCGHVFASDCDTEVIVHGWEQWGEDCVTRFRGMFAFAIADTRRETLFLARDRLGKKPLYYTILPDGVLAVASELKALLVHPAVVREIDPLAVEDYFAYGYVPDPRCIYRGIHKLPPAHTLLAWRGRGVSGPRGYWAPDLTPLPVDAVDGVAEELVRRLREAVTLRLMGEVPLGAFLSGGVDSSGVVAMMAAGLEAPAKTFSIAFDVADHDESAYAAAVARRHATEHRVSRVDPALFPLLDRLAGVYDEPFADNSALPTYVVCGEARRHVTVALSGDGGDEVFAGYGRYRRHLLAERLRRRLPLGTRQALFGPLGRVYPQAAWLPRPLRGRTTFQELAQDSAGGFFGTVVVVRDELRHGLYSPAFRRTLGGYHAASVLAGHMAAADTADPLIRSQYADLKTYLCGDILTKVDRASMAHSLEVRAPLLDHELVEWGLRLPASLKLRHGHGKWILKRALEPHVPRDVLYRPKQGFSVPISAWLRGPLHDRAAALARSGPLADSGLFDVAMLARLADRHARGLADHGAVLWSLLCFEAFLRRHESGDGGTEGQLAEATQGGR